ncbi:hypothetical protein PHIM7_110 [Sinorhizobium phage phiM7]|uniref:Uncharacterized protein n=2 Tax=Emdodecavirus TaxID=1980937 RepID=S5M6W1_9CAUD|nr:hypothetical protein AB690_gp124 [Sinorhizobium phage phiM12]YP_009601235.1 hypothetical protein FDH46_gp110 [Sinorhizobium phage phiM7]AGR47801.1 hypothetical protein SmphiM12_169 [Sinorhizobium phage phiM12]AKF12657.1 hypothetical protein PHIM7_110 [Sinorhizobium phage phiM7]AKF13017.1 hypothetical protein PHIM19_111 [Sinorhizobium phage phiM19]
MPSIIEDKAFVKNVENYIFKNDKRFAQALAAKKSQIPVQFRTSRYLFRGMILPQSLVDSIQKGNENLKLEEITSWTTDQKIAERFVSDKSKIVKNSADGVGVIFKKKIPDSGIILDIQNYVLFMDIMGLLAMYDFDDSTKDMGLEEFEVLVDSGVVLSKADITKVLK